MPIHIIEIGSKSQLRDFTRLPLKIYKDTPNYVPQLSSEEIATLSKDTNPAFDFCEAKYFLAYKSGVPVGRIAAIINHRVNDINNEKKGRFGFVDFIDDTEVSSALFGAVEQWLKLKGMDSVCGPMGFTDLDQEGLLIKGFSRMGTMITLYNHPYYSKHIEDRGFVKDVDWLEYRIEIPDSVPEKYSRISDIVKERLSLRVVKYSSTKKLIKDYGHAIFNLLNESYSNLYGYSPLDKKQIDYYLKMYLPMIPLDHVPLIVDSGDKLVAFGVAMPSLSKALRKANGRLYPFGFIHILKALRYKNNVVDLLLIGVHPSFQDKGVNALIVSDLIPIFNKRGYEYAESNPELESNVKVQNQWQYFDRKQHKRRRVFAKRLL